VRPRPSSAGPNGQNGPQVDSTTQLWTSKDSLHIAMGVQANHAKAVLDPSNIVKHVSQP
jgi:hypothetical protein